jgi:FixJ family two-component response regulator
VRLPGSSGWGQICSTSASGIVVAVTAIVPAVISATSDGRALVSQAAAAFETDVSALLSRLPPREREVLARIVSRLLVAHAADQGIDLLV